MNTFVKTKDGKVWILFSNNTEEETMDLIDQTYWNSAHGGYDVEFMVCENVPYSEILVTDTNLGVVKVF